MLTTAPALAWLLGSAMAALPEPDPDPGGDPPPPPLVDEGLILERGGSGSLHEFNVGSPTVTYDPVSERYVMHFEYRGEWGSPSRCAQGAGTEWGIGRATSPDGLTWAVDPTPALHPTAGSFWECAAVHPHVMRDDSGQWHLWFKAWQEQGKVCDDADGNPDGIPDPTWGCETITGIGYASSSDGVTWSALPDPVLTMVLDPTPEDFGWPRVVEVSGTWLMVFNYGDNGFTVATAPAPEGPWAWEGMKQTALRPASDTWTAGELIVADLTCHDEESPDMLTLWFGTNVRDPADFWGPPIGRNLGVATAIDVDTWEVEPAPRESWTATQVANDTAWRSWSSVHYADGGSLVYYQRFSDGGNDVGLAYTEDATWNTAAIQADSCTYPGAAPITEPESFDIPSDVGLTLQAPGLLSNDYDPERNPITASLGTPPEHGLIVVDPDGGVLYAPDSGFRGVDTFTYVASDGTNHSAPVQVQVTVTDPPLVAPLADDAYDLDRDEPLHVDADKGVQANDDVTGPVVVTDEPEHGTVELASDGSFVYTPDEAYTGPDAFVYGLLDGVQLLDQATVDLDVQADNGRGRERRRARRCVRRGLGSRRWCRDQAGKSFP